MNTINANLYTERASGVYSQQNINVSKTNQMQQSFLDIITGIQQARALTQPKTINTATRAVEEHTQTTTGKTAPNVVEEQYRLLQEIMESLSESARGSYPTEEQLAILNEKYKDSDFSIYRTYDNVERIYGGLAYTPDTGYSGAYGRLLNDLRDMGILSNQDINLLNTNIAHRRIGDSCRNNSYSSGFDRFWYERDIPASTILSGRGMTINIIDYLLGRADNDRLAAENFNKNGEPMYQAKGNNVNAEFFSAVAEARERLAKIIEAILNNAGAF